VAATDIVAGIDFGGSSAKIGLVQRNGTLVMRNTTAINPKAGFEDIMNLVACSLDLVMSQKPTDGRLIAIGVGAPGFTDKASGILVEGCRNIPSFHGRSIPEYMAARFGVPSVADNDATCAATGELLFGAGRKYRNFALITIGTGIGGGLVLDGKVFRGASGYAAEMGHICVDPEGPWCICGSRGCLEQFASGTAIISAYSNKAAKRGHAAFCSIEDIVARASEGEALALMTMEEAGAMIAQAFGSILNLLNLEACIVGGGVSRAGEVLLMPIRRHLPDHCWPLIGRSAEVIVAELSNNAGVIGAAAQAIERLGI
jgi:glucokinase